MRPEGFAVPDDSLPALYLALNIPCSRTGSLDSGAKTRTDSNREKAMSRGIVISAVAGGAAILAAATVAGVAVVNAASATEPAQPTRSVVADPAAEPAQAADIALPDVDKPSQAPAPGEPTVITIPASGSGQGEPYADDDAEGGDKAYGDRESDDDAADQAEQDDDQYGNGDSDDQYENGDDGDEEGNADEDHEDEGGHDDDDD